MKVEEKVLALFRECDAVWFHSGDPKAPHAELSSGLCSDGYFNCSKVFQYPKHCQTLAELLVKKLKQNELKNVDIDWVVGPAYAAIPLAHEVAKILRAKSGFTEKDPRDPKKMVWNRFNIEEGSTVLQVEDAISTCRTSLETRRVINRENKGKVRFLDIIGAIVLRPQKLPISCDGIKVVALIEKEIRVFKPEECPLCKAGSPRYRPKRHWKELTRQK